MSVPWHNLLRRLGSMDRTVIAYWSMSNGAKFYFNVPRASAVEEFAFSSEIEFPFEFSEIRSIEIFRSFGSGVFELTNDLGSILNAVASVRGLVILATSERITISTKPGE